MLSEEESAERFEDADENEDGKVTWEEYRVDAYGMDGSDEENIIQSAEEESVSSMQNNDIFFKKLSSLPYTVELILIVTVGTGTVTDNQIDG